MCWKQVPDSLQEPQERPLVRRTMKEHCSPDGTNSIGHNGGVTIPHKLMPPVSVVCYLAKLRDGVPELLSGSSGEGVNLMITETNLREIAPLFSGDPHSSTHPRRYLFAGTNSKGEAKTTCKYNAQASVEDLLGAIESAGTTPSNLVEWVKSELGKKTSANTIDQVLTRVLLDLEERMDALHEGNPNIFFVATTAKENVAIHASKWIAALTGYEPGDFIGRDCKFLQVRVGLSNVSYIVLLLCERCGRAVLGYYAVAGTCGNRDFRAARHALVSLKCNSP